MNTTRPHAMGLSAAQALPRFWADVCSFDWAQLDKSRAIAILPVAATEQHGPHLPLSVDTDVVNGIIARAVPLLPADLPALFLPTQTVGYSPEHMAFAGTLSLKSETLIRLWTEIADGVAQSGVRKLLIFNSHGGQAGLLDVVARDLRMRQQMLVYTCNWYQLPLQDAQGQDVTERFGPHEQRFGVHAGAMETAMMLALRPERVDMAKAQNFASSAEQRAARFEVLGNGKSAKLAWQMQDYNPMGAAGNAASATAEDGRALLDAAGAALAQLLCEIDRLPPDTLRL
jgi:creatinine amidohydrolase